MQHLSERFAGLIPQVKSLPELCATASIDGANVFDVGVDTGTELGALGKGGDTAGGTPTEHTQDIDDEKLDTDGEEHGGGWDSKDADGRVVRAGTGDELDHDEKPADGEIPVEPVKLHEKSVRFSLYSEAVSTYVEPLRTNDPAI